MDFLNEKSLEDSDLQKQLIENSALELARQLDEAMIEGLKRKGFEFSDRSELILFIKQRCSQVIDELSNTKIFYIDEIPFLILKQPKNFADFNVNHEKGSVIFSAEAGSIAFV